MELNLLKIRCTSKAASYFSRIFDDDGTVLSRKSGLKTWSLGVDTLGTASSQYVLVSSLSWKIVMEPRFKVKSEGQENHRIEQSTPGLEGEQFYHYTTEN